jgi:hypothetical protein
MATVIGLQFKAAAAPMPPPASVNRASIIFPSNSDTGRNPASGMVRPMVLSETASPSLCRVSDNTTLSCRRPAKKLRNWLRVFTENTPIEHSGFSVSRQVALTVMA